MPFLTVDHENVFALARLVQPNTEAAKRLVSLHAVRAASIAAMQGVVHAHGAGLWAADPMRIPGLTVTDYAADLRSRPELSEMAIGAMRSDLSAAWRSAQSDLILGGSLEKIPGARFGEYAGRLLIVGPTEMGFPPLPQ